MIVSIRCPYEEQGRNYDAANQESPPYLKKDRPVILSLRSDDVLGEYPEVI